jgi:hypothetical protein
MTTIRVLTPTIDTAPGEIAIGRLEIHNEATVDATYRVGVVGVGSESTPFDAVVAAGDTVVCEIPIQVSPSLGIGQHATAFEITSSRPNDPALLSPFTVSIASVERVELTAIPATIRARRRAKFHLDVENNELLPVTVQLDGSAPDVQVSFTPDRFEVAPGHRVVSTATVKGPRHWSGETTQHTLVITARGRAASTSITTPYIQRPVFAHRARMLLAGFTVIALWLAAIGGAALWLSSRDSGSADSATGIVAVDTNGDGIPDAFFLVDGTPVTGTDTNGDGVPDSFVDANGNPITGTDTDGDGVPDSFVDANGNPIKGVDTDGDGVVDSFVDANGNPITPPSDGAGTATAPRPTSTVLRGTIEADGGNVDDVTIELAPIALGAAPSPDAQIQAFAGAGGGTSAPVKIWSARSGRVDTGISSRLTQPVPPLSTTPKADGIWLFGDVPLGQSYEVAFSKPGFDTQSFVVTPPSDGTPVDLDVKLVASTGSLSGSITGPSGRLGGAEVTVTDGTNTFTTTAATDGDIGSWSLDGLSTPSVYTVSATLRGFGTEVLQTKLAAGEKRTGANLVMKPGVGAVSGRIIGENGQPLGGATVTATNGASSRTTTSLTEGNIGFFSIPQLDVPGTYTITVEFPSYVTQTRRVALGGSLDGINFALVGSSLTLSGRVLDPDGTGIVGAGVTLSTGDLTFRVQTASVPDAGAFNVDDLPPGLYTVTFDHYQHVTSTEFVTLQAGVPPAPLNVTLQRASGPPAVGTGSLRVAVIDPNAKDPITPEIKGATVKVYELTSGALLAEATQPDNNNFRFEKLPIGTYSVRVTAPAYNPSANKVVTIGIQDKSIEVFMQRLGAASGKFVDPTDPNKKFPGVRVQLYLEPRNDGSLPLASVVTNSESVWQTSADALFTGTYSIVVDPTSPALNGYTVRGTQVLDPAVPAPDNAMKFVVPADATEPIVVTPIVADPYPEITGQVSRPASGATPFVPIDNNGLKVEMACPGGTTTQATVSDVAGVVATPPAAALYDSFTFTRAQVDLNKLVGNCTLTYSADGYATVTKDLLDVQPSVGPTRTDRQQNVALTPPAPPIGGTVFWVDKGVAPADQRIVLDGVTVTSTRITSYLPGQGLNSVPQATSTTSTDTSKNGGKWTLPGQLFGSANYNFAVSKFDPAQVTLTIDESGIMLPPSTTSNATVTGTLADGIAVELKQPNNGTISGSFTIESSTLTNSDYANVTITATDPAGNPITTSATDPVKIVRPATGGAANTFEIKNAIAGTWTINFSEPDNYDFYGGGTPTVKKRLDPGGTITTANTSLVELGTLELKLQATGGGAISVKPTVTLTAQPGPAGSVNVPPTVLSPTAPGGNVFMLDNIAVATSNPATSAVNYTMAISVPGYDTTGSQAEPLSVLAGQVVQPTVVLPKFGGASGTVVGDINGDGTSPQDRPIDGTTTRLTITPITGNGGTPTGAASPVPTITGNGYSFSGPEGWYRIGVASVGFQPTSRDVQIINDTPNPQSPIMLAVVRGSIDLTVVRDLAGSTPVGGATYTVSPGTCAAPGAAIASGPVDAGGKVTVSSLIPRDYCLAVRELSLTSTELAFPAIATIMVPTSTTPLPAAPAVHVPVGSVTTVKAPLPQILPSVSGTVKAVNSNGDPVPLPASIGLKIDFATNSLQVSNAPGGVTPNTEVRTESINVIPTSGASSAPYTFDNVPVGVHTITPQANIAGYTPKASTVTVAAIAGNSNFGPVPPGAVPDIVYTVTNVSVVVSITGSGGDFLFPTLPKLTSPALPVAKSYTSSYDAAAKTLTFLDVAPEIGNFTLTISDPLHSYTPASPTFTVPVVPTTPLVHPVNIVATAGNGRVSGTLRQFDSPPTASYTGTDIGAGAVITLTSATTTTQTITTIGNTGSYQFDAAAGAYLLKVVRSGYTEANIPVTVVGGSVIDQPVRIDKLASITATVSNDPLPDGTAVSLVLTDLTKRPLVRDGTTNQFKLQVAAGTYKAIEVTAPLYLPISNPSSPDATLTLAIGGSTAPTFTLLPRTVSVTTNVAGANVSITVGGVTPVSQTTSPSIFASTDTAPALPLAGSGTATVSATGYRTNTAAIASTTSPQNIPVPLSGLVTATGTITAPDAAPTDNPKVIRAVSAGVTLYGSITSNVYSIPGLTNNADGTARTWTISYDKLGTGTGSTTVNVTATNTPAAGSITVNANPIAVTFTVKSNLTPTGVALDGATVTLSSGLTGTTGSDGTVIIQVPETFSGTWTAVKPPAAGLGTGYALSAAQNLAPFGNRSPVTNTPSVTLTTTTTVRVTQNGNGNAVAGATVTVCPPAGTDENCAGRIARGTTDASGYYTFNQPTDAGVYPIFASQTSPTKSDTTTLTVTAGAAGTLAKNPLVF